MIPLIVSLIGAEALERVIKAREYLIFTLQDVAESALFASWVIYDSGQTDKLDYAIELLDKTAKAYSYTVGLPLIVARFGEEIQQTPHLYEFFYQFPSAREHLQRIEMGITTYINKIDKELLDNIEKLYPIWQMDEETKKKAEANPLEVFNWIKDNIEALINQLGGDPIKFIEYACQRLSQTVYPEFLYNLPDWLVWILNPFIEIDWVVIKTIITLKYALNHYRLGQLADQLPRPYIKGMKVNLLRNYEVIAETEIKADGSFETEFEFHGLSELRINMHGLIYPIFFPTAYFSSYDNKLISIKEGHYPASFDYFVENDNIKVVIWGSDQDGKTPPHEDFNSILYTITITDEGNIKVEILGVYTPHKITVFVYDQYIATVSGEIGYLYEPIVKEFPIPKEWTMTQEEYKEFLIQQYEIFKSKW